MEKRTKGHCHGVLFHPSLFIFCSSYVSEERPRGKLTSSLGEPAVLRRNHKAATSMQSYDKITDESCLREVVFVVGGSAHTIE